MNSGTGAGIRAVRLLVLAGAAALLPGCLDSIGIDFQNLLLIGTHHTVSFKNDDQSAPEGDSSSTGTTTFDGILGVLVSTIDNQNGTVTGPNSETWTYNLTLDWILNVTNALGESLRGGTFLSSNVSILGSTSSGSMPSLEVFLRKSGSGFTDSSLSGDYFLCSFACDPAIPAHRSATGIVTFDGAGNFTGSVTENIEGTVSESSVVSGTYSVASDGDLSLVVGGTTLSGGMLNGAGVVVAASTTSGADPEVYVLVKVGGSFTDASLSGDYFASTFGFALGGPHHESKTGTLSSDGAGSFTFSLTDNDEGTITSETGSGTYTLGTDGTLIITAGPDSLMGGLLDGGSVAVLADITTDADPQIVVMVKK